MLKDVEMGRHGVKEIGRWGNTKPDEEMKKWGDEGNKKWEDCETRGWRE
jgi:hypothetical protein